jgi:hypothetical protein
MPPADTAPQGREVLCVFDVDRPNYLRLIEHDGYVYIEAHGRHNGAEVTTLIRIERGRFVDTLKGWWS